MLGVYTVGTVWNCCNSEILSSRPMLCDGLHRQHFPEVLVLYVLRQAMKVAWLLFGLYMYIVLL